MSERRRAGLLPVVGVLIFALMSSSAGAQERMATVSGHVLDKATRRPVAGAEVILLADSRSALTDSTGAFTLSSLTPGVGKFVVRAVGFLVQTFEVVLAAGDRLQPLIQLDSALAKGDGQALPRVAVTAPFSRGPRYADFERRQKTGRGQYFTAEDLNRGGFSNLQEAVRTARGVQVECGGGGGCYIRMSRAPMRCLPEYIVDERVDNSFGPRTPLKDIEGLEIYSGPSDVPGEFAGRNSGCGVIVIWTKSGPPRRRP